MDVLEWVYVHEGKRAGHTDAIWGKAVAKSGIKRAKRGQGGG